MQLDDPLSDFTKSTVTELGVSRVVYWIGPAGPSVLVCHELPGITAEVADFCRHVAAQGFQVSCPVLLGTPGGPSGYPKSAHSVLTTDLVPQARDEVVALFKRHLLNVLS